VFMSQSQVKPILAVPRLNGLSVVIRSQTYEKFIFLDRQTQIQSLILAFITLFWLVFTSITTIGDFLLIDTRDTENSTIDRSSLITIIEERNALRTQIENLNLQLQDSLKLVFEKEALINDLRKAFDEENNSTTNWGVSSRDTSGARQELTSNNQTDIVINSLLTALSSNTERLKGSESKVNELQIEIQNSLTQERIEDARINTILSSINQSINSATQGLDSILSGLNITSSNWNRQVRSLYQGISENTEISFNQSSQFDVFPNSDIVKAVENSLNELNDRRLVFKALPFANPLKGNYRVSDSFGMRTHPIYQDRRMHSGIDYSAPYGTNVYATGYGVVEFAGRESGYGNIVIIKHLSGIRSAYAHLSKINVKKGEKVALDQVIGKVGSTGVSTGNHLHYEIRVNKNAINPMKFIKV